MKKLPFQAVAPAKLLVESKIPVAIVQDNRVANSSAMLADLMHPTGFELHANERALRKSPDYAKIRSSEKVITGFMDASLIHFLFRSS